MLYGMKEGLLTLARKNFALDVEKGVLLFNKTKMSWNNGVGFDNPSRDELLKLERNERIARYNKVPADQYADFVINGILAQAKKGKFQFNGDYGM